MTSEADIENDFVKYAESRGCLAIKLRIDGQRGFPDRTVITPRGRVLFIEFKKPGGQLSYHQQRWIRNLRSLGHVAFSVDNAQLAGKELDRFLDDIDLREADESV